MAKIPVASWQGAHSGNFTVGRGGKAIKYVTIHHTAANNTSLKSLYANPARQGSAHFFVSNSRIEQYVDTKDTAWTNGNFNSNQQSITIETNGNWQNGYYDQKTLDNLGTLLKAIVDAHGQLAMNYHKDVSDKPTACPCDLKDKGYAKAVYDKVIQGDDSMSLTAESVKSLYRHLFKREGDAGGIKNYTGRTLDYTLGSMTGSAEFRAANTINNTVTIEKPVEVIREVIVTKEVIVEKPVEVIKEVEIIKEVTVPQADLTIGQLFEALINKLLRRGI